MRQFSLTSFREAQRVIVRACGRLILGQGADQDLWAAHVDLATATNVALDLSCVNDVAAQPIAQYRRDELSPKAGASIT
jgi:hypothetical protein